MKMDISLNIKNILKKASFCFLLLGVFSLVAPQGAEAKTITNSYNLASTSQIDYFDNLYKRSGYKYYLLGLSSNDSYYSNDYYFCLSNSNIIVSDSFNASANCSELYRYYRSSNNNYLLEKVNDSSLEFVNSIYYTSNYFDNFHYLYGMVFCITLGVFCIFITLVLIKIFGGD